jgi:hypothetical protein
MSTTTTTVLIDHDFIRDYIENGRGKQWHTKIASLLKLQPAHPSPEQVEDNLLRSGSFAYASAVAPLWDPVLHKMLEDTLTPQFTVAGYVKKDGTGGVLATSDAWKDLMLKLHPLTSGVTLGRLEHDPDAIRSLFNLFDTVLCEADDKAQVSNFVTHSSGYLLYRMLHGWTDQRSFLKGNDTLTDIKVGSMSINYPVYFSSTSPESALRNFSQPLRKAASGPRLDKDFETELSRTLKPAEDLIPSTMAEEFEELFLSLLKKKTDPKKKGSGK